MYSIHHIVDKRTKGQMDKRKKGQKDKRTKGQKDKRTKGQKNKRTKEQKDKRTKDIRTKGQTNKRQKDKIFFKNYFEVLCCILGRCKFLLYSPSDLSPWNKLSSPQGDTYIWTWLSYIF